MTSCKYCALFTVPLSHELDNRCVAVGKEFSDQVFQGGGKKKIKDK